MPAPERFRLSQSLARNGREVWEVDLAPDICIPVLEKGKEVPVRFQVWSRSLHISGFDLKSGFDSKRLSHLKSGLPFLTAHFGPHNSAISCLMYGGSSGDLALRRKPGNPDIERNPTYLWRRDSVLGHVWLMAQGRITSLAWHVLGRI
jgi:hypothetical protein